MRPQSSSVPFPLQALSGLTSVRRGVAAESVSFPCSDRLYHSIHSHLSSSGLRHFLRSPAHFRAYQQQVRVPTAAMNLGTALHMALLEPARCAAEVVGYEAARRGKAWEVFRAQALGKLVLNADEFKRLQGMIEAVTTFGTLDLLGHLEASERELPIYWRDPETGTACRARLDALHPDVIIDLKTSRDARPDAFMRSVKEFRYDIQAAFYQDAVRHFTGRELPFWFVVIESEPPHGIWIHEAGPRMLAHARSTLHTALKQFGTCVKTDCWEGYVEPWTVLDI